MLGFILIKEKTTSKAMIKRYAEIRSPCLVPRSNVKYGVVLPPLITHDSGFVINSCIHFQNSLRNPNIFNMHIKKE